MPNFLVQKTNSIYLNQIQKKSAYTPKIMPTTAKKVNIKPRELQKKI